MRCRDESRTCAQVARRLPHGTSRPSIRPLIRYLSERMRHVHGIAFDSVDYYQDGRTPAAAAGSLLGLF
jgi:hypothetical protein